MRRLAAVLTLLTALALWYWSYDRRGGLNHCMDGV